MSILIKYFVWLLSLLSLVIYYFLGTTLGHNNLGYLLEEHYSKKLKNKLEIISLDINNYPLIKAKVKINESAIVLLEGDSNRDNIDMVYQLEGKSLKWNSYLLSYPINLSGSMHGKISELEITGNGEIFHGKTVYKFVRKSSGVDNLDVIFTKISSRELLEFLKYDIRLDGSADITMKFDHFSDFRKKGVATIKMREAEAPKILKGVPFTLDAKIAYRDLLRDFSFDIYSEIGKLRVAHGYYNKAAGLMNAEYGLQIKELSYFEKILGHKYHGVLNTAGEAKYEMGKLSLLGDTTSYGGLLEYEYKHDDLELLFSGVSLEKLLRQLSFPALLSANVYGTASYNIQDKIVLINTKLKNTRFRRTNMSETIYRVAGIDIRKDLYNDSEFSGDYRDSLLTSSLKIDNGVNHLYLKDTKMNAKTNEVTSNFEVLMDGQEFSGDIYGTLEHPKVNLDMGKLIKYQINKQIKNFFGKEKSSKRERVEKEFHDMNLTKVKQKSRKFLNDFFK